MPPATCAPNPAAPFTATIAIPPDALTVRAEPAFVSQLTSEPLLGLKRRAFLDLLPEVRASGVPVIPVGKARLVPRAEIVAFLMSRATTPPVGPPSCLTDPIEEILSRGGTVRQ